MIKLTVEQVIKFQEILIQRTGGLAGIKDKSLIDYLSMISQYPRVEPMRLILFCSVKFINAD